MANRELKFRTWHAGHDIPQMVHFSVPNHMPTMQFTGLKDQHGKEIYEGDIIKIGEIIHQIEYLDSEGRFFLNDRVKGRNMWATISKRGEIIGNIYENPELLK